MGTWIIIEAVSLDRLKRFVEPELIRQLHQKHFSVPQSSADESLATNRFLRSLVDHVKDEAAWMGPYVDAVTSLPFESVYRGWPCVRGDKVSVYFDVECKPDGLMSALYVPSGANEFRLHGLVASRLSGHLTAEAWKLPAKIRINEAR